ncbi:MAG: Ig-like domain-containing protein [Eubacterium sp.]|nr:Ig-like domain-containing protein [Eubacterium sp.]
MKIRRLVALLLVLSLALVQAPATAKAEDYSNAKLSTTYLKIYRVNTIAEGKVDILDCPSLEESDFDYTWSNSKMDVICGLDAENKTIHIYSDTKGTTTIRFWLDDKVLSMTLVVAQVGIKNNSLLLVKGKKSTLKLSNAPSDVKWCTTNKKVATVTSKGVVKAKKIGNAVVYAKIGEERIGCAVSVVKKKMKIVIKKAYSLAKGKYSQPKRMKKGYYDCSSLVWRAYKKAKWYLANRWYAPVAADLAKYYVKKKKKKIKGGLSASNISKMKLRPGDLMFLTGANNGRYKGIYHVEMFTGYKCIGFDVQNKPILVTRWAVMPDGYYGFGKHLMARPK